MKINNLDSFSESHIKKFKLTGRLRVYAKSIYNFNGVESVISKNYYIDGKKIDCKSDKYFLKILKLKIFI